MSYVGARDCQYHIVTIFYVYKQIHVRMHITAVMSYNLYAYFNRKVEVCL